MLNRRLSAAALLITTALLATACTKDNGPGPDAAGDDQGAPQIEKAVPEAYRAAAAAYANFRKIDACGLHDPDAAAKVTGDSGDEILPSQDGLQKCTLRMHKGEFQSTWTLYLEVGDVFDASQRKDAAPETIGGSEVFVSESDRMCTLAKPLDDTYAIVLNASPGGTGDDKPSKPACQVLKQYAAELGPIWKEMPKRGSERTSPDLKLAQLDPCTLASGALDMFGADAVLEPSGPFVCTAKPSAPQPPSKDKKVGRNEVAVSFTADDDPAALVKTGDQTAKQVTIAGSKAVIYQNRTGCTTYVVFDPNTTIEPDNRATDGGTVVQLIRIGTATCDVAQQATEKVLAKVGRR